MTRAPWPASFFSFVFVEAPLARILVLASMANVISPLSVSITKDPPETDLTDPRMLFDLPSAAATPAAKMRTAISVRVALRTMSHLQKGNRPREKFHSTHRVIR